MDYVNVIGNGDRMETGQIVSLLEQGLGAKEVSEGLGVKREVVEEVAAAKIVDSGGSVENGDLTPDQVKMLRDSLFMTAISHPDENVRTKVGLELYKENRVSQRDRMKIGAMKQQTGMNILVIQQALQAAARNRDAHEM